ncbi:putative short-chain dehydrogenase [Xylaria sp. FL0933]|nr:putative short-chain dehydrogenase [Xylaria sp. FL0933]
MMAHCKGTILITGANGGLGHELVSKIVSTPEFVGYHGIYTVRNPGAAPALRSALSRSISAHHHTVESLDLSKLSSVRAFAEAVNGRVLTGELLPIRALILSAGYYDMGKESYTEEGFDMSFAANYLGHWLLTLMLLKSMNQECGRIVIVGSSSHDVEHPMHKFTGYYEVEEWKTFFKDDESVDAIARGTWATKGSANPAVIGGRRYGAAKICLVMMIGELQRRLDTDPILSGVSAVGVDPGTMYTGLTRRSDCFTRFLLLPAIMLPLSYILALFQRNPGIRTPSRSARDVLRAAIELDSKYRGVYFDGTELGSVSPEAADIGKRRIVWQHSVKYTTLTERDTALISWA